MPEPTPTAQTTLAQSWLKHQAAAASAAADQKTPSIVVEAIVLRVHWHLRELAPLHDKIEALLSADRKKAYKAALVALPTLLEALQYAHDEYGKNRIVFPGLETDSLKALDTRAAELKEIGLRWLDGLALLGKVPRRELDVIRAGKGYMDRASDLVHIHGLLAKHETWLKKQAAEAEPGVTLITPALLTEMDTVAVSILNILKRESGPVAAQAVDWKAQRLGCFLLCHTSWESVRTAARFYFDEQGDKDAHKALVQLRGMRQFKLRP